MSKDTAIFDGIMDGLQDALAIAQGKADPATYRVHIPDDLDVKAVRKATGLSQQAFSDRFGFNLSRLRDLEQRRTKPDSAIWAYLLVIRNNPKAVLEALQAA